MSKFAKMVNKTVEKKNEVEVTKMPSTTAPKKENSVSIKSLRDNKDAAAILDMAFMLKQSKKAIGETLTEKEIGMFQDEIFAKTATVVSDLADVIPSGFSGSFVQDMYAETSLQGIFGLETIGAFGMTDTIGDYGMEAYVVDELGTPADTNDSMIDFEYRGGKLFAKTYISYEAIADASIDMLTNKRNGLLRAMAVAVEKVILNGQAGDDGVVAPDARTLFRGIRKLGLNKGTPIDFGGAALDEATFRTKFLEMQEMGGLYTSWDEIQAGNVILTVPTKVYNKIVDFDGFSDAGKAGQGSTLTSGKKVSTIFGCPVVTQRFYPAAVNASGVIDAVPANNTLQSINLINVNTFKVYAVAGSAIMETDKNVETQKYVMTNSLRIGGASIFDSRSSAPTDIDATKTNIVSGINILA